MMLRFLDALLVKYGNTSGRSDRTEFWCFHFFNLLLTSGLLLLCLFVAGTLGDSLWAYLCHGVILTVLGFLIVPAYCTTARRFHDFGWSSHAWIMFVPFLNILLIIVGLIPGNPGLNDYGNPPNKL